MGTLVRRPLGWMGCALCVVLPIGLAGCGDDAAKPSNGTSEEALTYLDCTDVKGRPENIPDDPPEFYHPDVMEKWLEQDEILRERFGGDRVSNCAEARRFARIYQEEMERIDQEWLEKNPEVLPDPEEVIDASEDEPPAEDAPQPPEEPSTEVEKIANGIDSNYWFAVKLDILGGQTCSATIIAEQAVLTAAHCVPFSGWYWTTVSRQASPGVEPVVMLGGATWMYFYRHTNYKGDGDYPWDAAVGTLYPEYKQSFPESYRVRIWAGKMSNGDLNYQFGYGATAFAVIPGHQHYGYGIVDSLHNSYYWMDPASSPPRTMCAGDSGGPTGTWHGGYFMLHAINSHYMCGESLFDGRYGTYVTRVRYFMPFIEDKLATIGASCRPYTMDGEAYRKCW